MARPGRFWPDTRNGGLPRPAHWSDAAACRDAPPGIFFPDGDEDVFGAAAARAKGYCRRCPVIGPCLAGSLERREPIGVWGGLDEDERKALLRQAAARVAEVANREEAADVRAPAA